MSKITRIAYNSSGWQHPTGDARREEASGTYNSDNGFGHEDWLFRSEWQIEGWRYAFLQGDCEDQNKGNAVPLCGPRRDASPSEAEGESRHCSELRG